MNKNSFTYLLFVIILLLGILFGVLANDAIRSSSGSSSVGGTSAADENTTSLYIAYDAAILQMLRSGYTGTPDYSYAYGNVNIAATRLATAYESEFGKSVATKWAILLEDNSPLYADYLIDEKKDSTDQIRTISQALRTDERPITALIAKAENGNSSFVSSKFAAALATNDSLLLTSFNDYVAQQYSASYVEQESLFTNVHTITDMLASS
jgi:hypothetical protein